MVVDKAPPSTFTFSPSSAADGGCERCTSAQSDGMVANRYNPFITPYPSASGGSAPGDPGCPAVWVGDATGK